MAHLPSDHPLFRPYRHLLDYGQEEYADKIACYALEGARLEDQLRLLQAYVDELEKRDPSKSYEAQRQRTMEQRFHIDSRKGGE